VDVSTDGKTERVDADHWLKVKPDRKMNLAAMDLSAEDVRDFVKHNRQRDIIRHLGNPTILVALSNGNERERQAAFGASKSLATTLKHNGFPGTSITRADKSRYSFKRDGLIEWRDKRRPDYFVLGHTDVEQIRQINGGKHSARATGKALVFAVGSKQPIVKVEARVRGEGATIAEAGVDAMKLLGTRLGRKLVPSMIAQLQQERDGTVRIEISGEGSRGQVQILRQALQKAERIKRVTVVPRPGEGVALAVAGDVDAKEIADVLRKLPMVTSALPIGRAVRVRLAPAGEGQAGAIRRTIKSRDGTPAGGAGRPFGHKPHR
jgi:hypothetical protein